MALPFEKKTEEIEEYLFKVAESYGLIRTDRFVGALIETIANVLGDEFRKNYDLSTQASLETATGTWLDEIATLAGVNRVVTREGVDMSLDNVYLKTSNDRDVIEYTAGQVPMFIPAGTAIYDKNGIPVLETLDTISMSGSRAFTRVVVVSPGPGNVLPGTYTTGLKITSPTEAVFSSGVELPIIEAVVQREIIRRNRDLSDEELRSIVKNTAASKNILNRDSVYRIMGLGNIGKFVIKSFNNGSSSFTIYIEPTKGTLTSELSGTIKSFLSEVAPEGTAIRVSPMVGSVAEMKIVVKGKKDIETSEMEQLKTKIKQRTIAFIDSINSGEVVDFGNIEKLIIEDEEISIEEASIRDLKVNNRSLIGKIYNTRDIEYLYATNETIKVEVL